MLGNSKMPSFGGLFSGSHSAFPDKKSHNSLPREVEAWLPGNWFRHLWVYNVLIKCSKHRPLQSILFFAVLIIYKWQTLIYSFLLSGTDLTALHCYLLYSLPYSFNPLNKLMLQKRKLRHREIKKLALRPQSY